MANILRTRGAKRKLEDKAAAASGLLSKSSKVTMLSPTLLLLEIPPDTNASLPVWDAVKSQKVGVTWMVNPYSISVHLTPQASEQKNSSAACVSETTASVGQTSVITYTAFPPQIQIQSITQQQSTSCVLFTFSQNPNSAAPIIISVPVSITHSKQGGQPGILGSENIPSTSQSSARVANELQTCSKMPDPAPFYTKSSPDVNICDDFLLGMCSSGEECRMHHTPYPFHWQLWSSASHKWVDLSPRSQVLLERIYCDPNNKVTTLKDGDVCYTVNFESMELDNFSKYDGIRRLTNSDSAVRNPHFPSRSKIYWWNNSNYEEYRADLSSLLLKKMSEKKTTCSFRVASQKYEVDFTTMTQTNATTGFQRDVRCRPFFYSPQSLQPHLKTIIQSNLSQHGGDPPGANFSVDPLKEFGSWYPPVWCQTSEDYSLVDVPAGTQAYQKVKDLFHSSLPETRMDIISIHQVQNMLHWDKYQRQKVHMEKQDKKSKEPLEKHLFHGTTKEASESICYNNFDPRVAGVNGNTQGFGSYFAASAWMSNTFTDVWGPDGVRHMFLAKVLVGKVCLGKQFYRRPPLLSKTQRYALYDTCVDNKEDPKMFVVFDSCQCYPYYLIKYKELPLEINIHD